MITFGCALELSIVDRQIFENADYYSHMIVTGKCLNMSDHYQMATV